MGLDLVINVDAGDLATWVAALGTLLAVVVALFGDWIRGTLSYPKLKMEVPNFRGELNPYRINENKFLNIRWYHIRVSRIGTSRLPLATDVRAYIDSVLIKEGDLFRSIWTQRVPLQIRHQSAFQPRTTIGNPLDFDFIALKHEEGPTPKSKLQFRVQQAPHNCTAEFEESVYLLITLSADCNESPPVYFKVNVIWNGRWHIGEEEMSQNLKITVIDEDASPVD